MLRLATLALATLLVALPMAPPTAAADETEAAEAVVDRVVTQALEALIEQREALQDDDDAARAFFEEHVRPWMDFELMTRFAMGREARQASEEQLSRFGAALERRVANLYIQALQGYLEDTVEFAREGEVVLRTVSQDDRRAVIAARLRGAAADDLALRIQLHHREDTWRVFDIETSGVSLLLVFRDAVRDAAGGQGVDAMIAALEEGRVDVEDSWEAETEATDS